MNEMQMRIVERAGKRRSARRHADVEKGRVMSKKVWLITGAGRGMGADFARAALAAGHSVVASGRDRERVSKALGTSSDCWPSTLDVTSHADAEAAAQAAVDRFGRIDVLVNNAASFYAGYFEELTPDHFVAGADAIGYCGAEGRGSPRRRLMLTGTSRPRLHSIEGAPRRARAMCIERFTDASQLELEMSFGHVRRAPSSRSASISAESAAGCCRRLG